MTFDPSNAFDSSPASGIGAEIDMLAADFAALGVNGHHAVPLWMGKPNRFTGVVMTSAQEVLDYIAEEVKQQAAARAAAHAPGPVAGATGDADGAASTSAPAEDKLAARAELQARKAQHRDQVQQAGDAWRKAIRDRDAAILEWNRYVESLRVAYTAIKDNRPR